MGTNRRDTVLSLLRQKGEIRLAELRELFPEVSEMTLRRDLTHLSEKGLAVRTHGGARLAERPPVCLDFSCRVEQNMPGKALIAQRALPLIEENCSVFFDAGTTTMALARAMPDRHVFCLTNAPNIGVEIAKREQTEVICLGGALNKTTVSVTGPFALRELDELNIDIAFVATAGYSPESGFTNPYAGECELKRKVITQAKKVIVLMDHTKLRRSLPFTFAAAADIDAVVTDCELPPAVREQMIRDGVTVFDGRSD